MKPHALDQLWAYALGTLDADQRCALEADLAASPELRRELKVVFGALEALAPPPQSPSPAVLERVLASAQSQAFMPWTSRLADLLDVDQERARALLEQLASGTPAWQESPWQGVHLWHLKGGPAVAGADLGFVRLASGASFPRHSHTGEEHTLVLQGSYLDLDDGTLARPGDCIVMAAGSSHHYVAQPGPDCVLAARVMGGVVMADGTAL